MKEIIMNRHSVRQYLDKPIEEDKKEILVNLVEDINQKSNLHIQCCFDEKEAFSSFMARYGKFENVSNYIALVGENKKDEQIGYWGEKIVLKAQELGLNTCWVAMTYSKGKAKVNLAKGEKIYCVLSLGYGKNQGVSHKIKKPQQVSNISNITPDWFNSGVELSLYAPTAMNQQKFKFIFNDGKVETKAGRGFYTKIDLGIAKCHFEIGAEGKYKFDD